MKRLFCIFSIALMLILFSAVSFAEDNSSEITFLPASAERLGVDFPDGMVGEVITADGIIHVIIDDAATDWQKVLCSGDAYPYVRIRPYVKRPSEDFESHVSFNGCYTEDYDYVLETLERDIAADEGFTNKERGNNHPRWSNGYFTGEIVPARSLLIPRSDGNPDEPHETWGGAAICWVDYDDPSVRFYEKVDICVSHKSEKSFNIPLRFISADSLSATRDIALPDNLEITEIKNGEITFSVLYRKQPEGETANGENENTPEPLSPRIAIKAPEGAVSGYIAYEPTRHEDLVIDNGIACISDFYEDFADNTRIDERLYTIVWIDAGGDIVDYGFFYSYIIPTDSEPWACYVENWHAVDSSRVEIINGAEGCGVTAAYNQSNGVFHVGYDSAAAITGAPESIQVFITPPEGAAAYRMNGSGGNMIMGKDDWVAEDQHFVVTNQDYQLLGENEKLCVYDREPVREIEAGPITVYIQQGDIWKYGGGVQLIYWYASEDSAVTDPENPMRIEYVCDTNGVLCLEKRVPLITSEDNITYPVTEITPIGEYPWKLVIRRYPQKGSNAFHWELVMENETGAYQPLTENMVFYIPYPKGHDNHTQYTYELRHYDDEYGDFSLVDARRTEYGLRFEVASLSPFVLSWDPLEITSVAVLPADVRGIDEEAFTSSSFQQFILPEGVTTIGARAFADCKHLLLINLPASVTAIADNAFSGSDSMTAEVVEGSHAHVWCIANDIPFTLR